MALGARPAREANSQVSFSYAFQGQPLFKILTQPAEVIARPLRPPESGMGCCNCSEKDFNTPVFVPQKRKERIGWTRYDISSRISCSSD